MCGIHEVVHRNGASHSQLRKEIGTMLQVAKHRGPDQSDVLILENKAALGMNRLSIIAPDEHSTIQKSESGNFAVFNGEIVNHQTVRRMLKTPPSQFADSAVILPLLEERGQRAMGEL